MIDNGGLRRNAVKRTWRYLSGYHNIVFYFLAIFLFEFLLTGCGPSLSTPEQVRKFEKAGPVMSGAAEGENGQKSSKPGPYRVISGDILKFQLPAVLRVVSSDLLEWLRPSYGNKDVEAYLVRVNELGNITLPIIGEINVGGMALAEIEADVIGRYYPKYVVEPPMVVCEVEKYKNENERVFAVMGLVQESNSFPYPPDVQYNLMEALAFAGGLDMIADPRFLTIYRMDDAGEIISATFSIDDRAFADASEVVIKPGDIVYVDHTFRTRTNKFLANIFHITFGADVRSYNTN